MKVMIIEDDMLVRMGIKSLIPWLELGLEVVCEARDGAEAVEMYKTFLPDIALVDILLPKMNGLDFIECVKPLNPHGEFIVLTCNQDFDTVRKSLRLGVHDFIVKSTMELEELQAVLKQLTERMTANRLERVHHEEGTSEHGLDAIRRTALLRDWLHGLYNGTSTKEFAEASGELKHFLKGGEFQAWILELELASDTTESLNYSQLTTQKVIKIGQTIENMSKELYRGKQIGLVENIKESRWHVLMHCPDPVTIDPAQLIDSVSQYLGFSVSVATSRRFTDWQEWMEFDREAAELLSLKYFQEDKHLFQGEAPEAALSDAIFIWKKSIGHKLSSFQFEQAIVLLEEIQLAVCPPYPKPLLVQNMLADILFQLKQVCEMSGWGLLAAQIRRTDLLACASLKQAVHLLHSYLVLLQDPLAREKNGSDKKKFADAAEVYIQEHKFEEISLNGIAAQLHVSPVYLSRLYKEEKGVNFSEAVLNAKVEQAEMMIKSGMTVTEIADKLGYLNLSSFTRMFKKIKGMAPSHYAETESE